MKGLPPAEFFQRHLRDFVPPDSFDAHAHLYRPQDASAGVPAHLARQGRVGWPAYQQALAQWMGDRRPAAGLFFAFPHPTLERAAANQMVLEEIRSQPDNRGLRLIHPDDDPADVEADVDREQWAGFKVYHVYAPRDRTFEAAPGEFLPDWAWRIADQRALVIMLHLVRPRALADPVNQQYLRARCERFPRAQVILAHAARGFCGAHTVAGVESLRGLDNVHFDTSAICEPPPLEAILRQFGPSRLMFGTDFPVSEILGRCVSVGDGFLWLGEENVDWQSSPFAQPLPVGVESLLALRQACRTMSLRDDDVERIFGTNARRLLGIDAGGGEQTAETYGRAKRLIPGGTNLLSKRPEMFAPDRWPAYFAEARGCEVTDLDGRQYVDMTTSGIGACLLGYSDPDVTAAVVRRVRQGSMSTLNSPEEVELAELLLALHPWAEQVRYCRTGGESMAAAIRIARAATGAERIAFCGYHGWSDWYLAANLPAAPDGAPTADVDPLRPHLLPGLEPAGVPQGLAGTALPFGYNRLDELRTIVAQGGALAAVVMEPTRSEHPRPGFLEGVRDVCDQRGAALIFDEISAGWRMALGGAHLNYGVQPDIAVFAKAIGNGHPLAAIIGRRRFMEAAQDSFISSTYWTEGVGPAAALAAIGKMQRIDVPAHVRRIGEMFRTGGEQLARRHGVPLRVTGHAALLRVGFEHPEAAALGTLLTSRMLDRGFLCGSGFYPSLAHTERHVARFLDAAAEPFAELGAAVAEGDIRRRLTTPVRQSGFTRLT